MAIFNSYVKLPEGIHVNSGGYTSILDTPSEVLLVGDPSCGKSQMLRFVMNTAGDAQEISTENTWTRGDW